MIKEASKIAIYKAESCHAHSYTVINDAKERRVVQYTRLESIRLWYLPFD